MSSGSDFVSFGQGSSAQATSTVPSATAPPRLTTQFMAMKIAAEKSGMLTPELLNPRGGRKTDVESLSLLQTSLSAEVPVRFLQLLVQLLFSGGVASQGKHEGIHHAREAACDRIAQALSLPEFMRSVAAMPSVLAEPFVQAMIQYKDYAKYDEVWSLVEDLLRASGLYQHTSRAAPAGAVEMAMDVLDLGKGCYLELPWAAFRGVRAEFHTAGLQLCDSVDQSRAAAKAALERGDLEEASRIVEGAKLHMSKSMEPGSDLDLLDRLSGLQISKTHQAQQRKVVGIDAVGRAVRAPFEVMLLAPQPVEFNMPSEETVDGLKSRLAAVKGGNAAELTQIKVYIPPDASSHQIVEAIGTLPFRLLNYGNNLRLGARETLLRAWTVGCRAIAELGQRDGFDVDWLEDEAGNKHPLHGLLTTARPVEVCSLSKSFWNVQGAFQPNADPSQLPSQFKSSCTKHIKQKSNCNGITYPLILRLAAECPGFDPDLYKELLAGEASILAIIQAAPELDGFGGDINTIGTGSWKTFTRELMNTINSRVLDALAIASNGGGYLIWDKRYGVRDRSDPAAMEKYKQGVLTRWGGDDAPSPNRRSAAGRMRSALGFSGGTVQNARQVITTARQHTHKRRRETGAATAARPSVLKGEARSIWGAAATIANQVGVVYKIPGTEVFVCGASWAEIDAFLFAKSEFPDATYLETTAGSIDNPSFASFTWEDKDGVSHLATADLLLGRQQKLQVIEVYSAPCSVNDTEECRDAKYKAGFAAFTGRFAVWVMDTPDYKAGHTAERSVKRRFCCETFDEWLEVKEVLRKEGKLLWKDC